MSKKLVMSIVMSVALVLAGGSYFSALAMGDWTKHDMDTWKKEPMKYHSHSSNIDGSEYGQPKGNMFGPDSAKNSLPKR